MLTGGRTPRNEHARTIKCDFLFLFERPCHCKRFDCLGKRNASSPLRHLDIFLFFSRFFFSAVLSVPKTCFFSSFCSTTHDFKGKLGRAGVSLLSWRLSFLCDRGCSGGVHAGVPYLLRGRASPQVYRHDNWTGSGRTAKAINYRRLHDPTQLHPTKSSVSRKTHTVEAYFEKKSSKTE